jgi:ribonuclease BN (tRNA processing enzyme)
VIGSDCAKDEGEHQENGWVHRVEPDQGCACRCNNREDNLASRSEIGACRQYRRARPQEVPDGPVCGELADGRPLTLQDGRTIDPEDVLGPPAQGTKLVVGGDTETTGGLSEHVRDADLLVIEATFLQRDAVMAWDTPPRRGRPSLRRTPA